MSTAPDELKAAGTTLKPAGGVPAWQVIHSGTADSASTPAARAVMRTSDGEFRITASQVDGKVGLTIEMLKPDLGAKVPEAKVLGRKVTEQVTEPVDEAADPQDAGARDRAPDNEIDGAEVAAAD